CRAGAQRLLHQELRLRTRNQGLGTYLEVQRPEFLNAGDVLQGNPGAAAAEQPFVTDGGAGRDRIRKSAEQGRAGAFQNVSQEQLGIRTGGIDASGSQKTRSRPGQLAEGGGGIGSHGESTADSAFSRSAWKWAASGSIRASRFPSRNDSIW